ncbi:porin [Burkholderia sp. PU8-34]
MKSRVPCGATQPDEHRLAAAFVIAAGCAAFGSTASAQGSVTLYGLLDAGIQYKTQANAAGNSVVTSTNANAAYPSRFGLRIAEDLGGGMQVIAQLENGFSLSTGALASADTMFNRIALVGLRSDRLGTLTFGHQYSVQYDKTVLYDPTLFNNYSIYSLNIIPPATVRLDNSVKYLSPEFRGLSVEGMFGFGQQLPGHADAGRYWGIAAEYKPGDLWLRAGYEQVNGTISGSVDRSSDVDRRTSFAARYAFDPFNVSGGVVLIRGNLQASPDGNVYWLAAQYMPTPFLKIAAEGGRYVVKGSGARPTLANLSVFYWLSKRTNVYATAGYMVNGGGSNFGVTNYTTTPVANISQLGAAAGLVVRF